MVDAFNRLPGNIVKQNLRLVFKKTFEKLPKTNPITFVQKRFDLVEVWTDFGTPGWVARLPGLEPSSPGVLQSVFRPVTRP